MRLKNIFFMSALVFCADTALSAQAVTFPEILSWKKDPEVQFENKKIVALKKNSQLKNAFTITTRADEEITLTFSGGEQITVLAKSTVKVPLVSPDSGAINEFFITDGSVRYRAPENIDPRSRLRLKSAFFDLKIPALIDGMFGVNMSLPQAKIQIITGEMKAEFLDFEKKQLLGPGDSVTFNGEFERENKSAKDVTNEGREIKYDYLLDGRKSPHGTLTDVQKFDFNVYVQSEKNKLQDEKKELERLRALEILKYKKQKAFEDSFLCKKPFGQRDECYWIKKDATCFRYRCHVGGDWGDRTERPVDAKCKAQAQVGKCDF